MRHLYGSFTSLDGQKFRVDIECSTGTGEAEIVLSDKPFVTSMSSDADSIYAPVKGSGATVELLTEDVEFEIYSVDPLGTKVTLTNVTDDENHFIEWTGFATPCAYSQEYDKCTEYLQIECVDAISVLKSIKYYTLEDDVDPPVDGNADRFPNRTFIYLINKCLGKSKSIKKLYINTAVQVNSPVKNEAIYEKISISEQNFFDKRENASQTDVNLSWTAYDVLFEICQFMGVTITLHGSNAYIIDYDSLLSNWNTYYVYDIDGFSDLKNKGTVNLEYNHLISGNTISETGTRLSIGPVYNKVTVKDEFNIVGDDDDNIEENITGTNVPASGLCNDYLAADVIEDKNFDLTRKHNRKTFCMSMLSDKELTHIWYLGHIMKFMKKSNYTFHKYHQNTMAEVTGMYENDTDFTDTQILNGAFYIKMYHKVVSDNNGWVYDWVKKNPYPNTATTDKKLDWWTQVMGVDSETISLTNYFVMMRHLGTGIGPGSKYRTGNEDGDNLGDFSSEDCLLYPYITYKKKGNMVFTGEDSYIVIKGDVLSHQWTELPSFITGVAKKDSKWCKKHGDYKRANQFFLWAQLSIGGMYFNGTTWQDTECNFKLWWRDPDADKVKVGTYCDKFYPFLDTNVDAFTKTEEGCWIHCPNNQNLTGEFKFVLYANRDMWGRTKYDAGHNHRWDRYYSNVIVIRNFEIKTIISNGLMDDWGRDTDTFYSNSLDTYAVDEFPEIVFRITTFDDKNPNYSSPLYFDGTSTDDLMFLTHKSLFYLYNNQGTTEGNNNLKAEELLIQRIVNQYEKPRVEFEYNLQNLHHKMYGVYTDSVIKNRHFIMDYMEIDYANNSVKAKLVEKA